jgi:CubicO group peptidase (beta-lactamase class C family)
METRLPERSPEDWRAAVEALAGAFMRTFGMPGLAIAVVQPQQPPLTVALGVRALGDPERVDAHTSFAVASNSKAYLAACLAMLVDEGRLAWDDLVVKHLPQFRMFDATVTGLMTVRDLLVHRSGLPLGAGDLMQFPCTDHTRDDVLRALRHFKPATGFRTGYAYDNCLYIVAGAVLEAASGLDWDTFAAQRIFAPLGMAGAVANPNLVTTENRAARHVRLGPPAIGMGPLERITPDESPVIGPAGGINLSVADSLAWLQVQLGRGALPGGPRLWSKARAAEMWTPHTLISSGPGPTAEMPQRAVMQAYALGWAVSDFRGRRMLTHGGGLAGQASRTALLPDAGVGLLVCSNAGDAEPVSALRYALLDLLTGEPAFDWIAAARQTIAALERQVVDLVGCGDFPPPPGAASLSLARYAGRYRDPWYGDIVVSCTEGGLAIDFTRTPVFKSALEPFGDDAFRTRFPRGAGEDAVVRFEVADGAVVGVTMRALSPIADFSFDFKDLAFVPVRDDQPSSAE